MYMYEKYHSNFFQLPQIVVVNKLMISEITEHHKDQSLIEQLKNPEITEEEYYNNYTTEQFEKTHEYFMIRVVFSLLGWLNVYPYSENNFLLNYKDIKFNLTNKIQKIPNAITNKKILINVINDCFKKIRYAYGSNIYTN